MSRSEFGAARIALATIALLLPSMAAAQSTRDRLDALEARVLQTESVLQGQGLAELSTRLDELAAQVRALRGELEAQAEEQLALRKRLAEHNTPSSPATAAALALRGSGGLSYRPGSRSRCVFWQESIEAQRCADRGKARA